MSSKSLMVVKKIRQFILFAAWRNKVMNAVAQRLGAGMSLCLEETMPKVNLSRMTVEALMDLRKQVDGTLLKRRAELEQQLERMGRAIAVVGRGGSVLKGRMVPPKYRGPSGET